MAAGKTLKTNWELDVAAAHDVLDLEVGKLCVESELLNDASILARGKLAVVFGLGAGHDHLAGSEDESRGLGLSNAHDDGRETLRVVLGVSGVQSDGFEIKTAVQVHGRNNVLQRWDNTCTTNISLAPTEHFPVAQEAYPTPRSRPVLE